MQTFAENDTDVMDVFVTMTAAAHPDRLWKRSKSFAVSLLLHCLLLIGFASLPSEPRFPVRHEISQYSVRLLQIAPLPPVIRLVDPSVRQPAAQNAALLPKSSASAPVALSPAERSARSEPVPQKMAVSPRQFVAPPAASVQPVKQTLVRADVPPAVRLREEVPLPVLMLEKLENAPAYRRQFVAPAAHNVPLPAVAKFIPAVAPEIQNPASANMMKVPPVVMTEMPRLPVPPPAPSPARATGTQPVPQLKGPPPPEPASSHLAVLSLPANPITFTGILAIPPVNQIAAARGGSESAPAGGQHGQGEALASGSGTAAGAPNAAAALNTTAAESGGTGSVAGGASKLASRGIGTGMATGDTELNASLLPGTSRIALPKEGTFGVVVMGSAASEPYPESAGVLSGRMVYTVYLRVGQRKNWILQYCLPPSAMAASHVEGTTTQLEAPWPYLMVRPDQTSDSDYVLVRGNINDKGRFEQLALVFPQDLEKKELLLRSLGQWEFRPANRDGIPTGVEVLLIIPREE